MDENNTKEVVEVEEIAQRYLERRDYMGVTELCHIMRKHDCDKGLGAHNYSTLYHALFKGMRHQEINIIEIGYNKHGIAIAPWRDYFTKANIYGADNHVVTNPPAQTKILLMDERFPVDIHKMFHKIDQKMDVIIDDGIHTFDGNWNLFIHAVQYLKNGGLYIIEDLTKETRDKFMRKRDEILSKFNIDIFQLIEIPYSRNNYDNRMLILRKRKVEDSSTSSTSSTSLSLSSYFVIATAATQEQSKSLIQFLCSLVVNKVVISEIIVFDMGLDATTLRILHDMFSAYAVKIKKVGKLSRAVMMEEAAREIREGMLFWCEPENKLKDDLSPMIQWMNDCSIYSPGTREILSARPETLEYFEIPTNDIISNTILRDISQVCFRITPETMHFISGWAELTRGSGFKGSEDAFFTVLFYRFLQSNPSFFKGQIRNDYIATTTISTQ